MDNKNEYENVEQIEIDLDSVESVEEYIEEKEQIEKIEEEVKREIIDML